MHHGTGFECKRVESKRLAERPYAAMFAPSATPCDNHWAQESLWGGSLMIYQVHSENTYDFSAGCKVIHE